MDTVVFEEAGQAETAGGGDGDEGQMVRGGIAGADLNKHRQAVADGAVKVKGDSHARIVSESTPSAPSVIKEGEREGEFRTGVLVYDIFMRCPDCGNNLVKTAVVGFDESHRCENCGGVWLTGWVLNRIAQNPEENFTIEKKGVSGAMGGNGSCPTDGNKLFVPGGEELPVGVQIQKCNKCGWWWLPDDQIFGLRQAYSLRKDYMKVWNSKPRWQALVWPALISVVLTAGLVGGVSLTVQRQQASIGASVGITNWSVTSLGVGTALVNFDSGLGLSSLQYKSQNESTWHEVPASCQGQKCMATLTGLVPGEEYSVRVLGKEYTFKVQ